jgi:V/A-type H+-transporting ATPase subunit G/H
MIQEARAEVDSNVEAAKEEANDQAKHVLLAKEEEAGKEAVIITNTSESDIKESLRGSENNVEAAADIIIETVL